MDSAPNGPIQNDSIGLTDHADSSHGRRDSWMAYLRQILQRKLYPIPRHSPCIPRRRPPGPEPALTGGALSLFSVGDMRALGAPPPVVALCQWHGAAMPQAPSPAGAYRKPQRPVAGSARGSGRRGPGLRPALLRTSGLPVKAKVQCTHPKSQGSVYAAVHTELRLLREDPRF
jgi:hypothetical protein